MQQASNSTLSLIAQKYSLDLSNQNHIKNVKKIELFVAHILLYFSFPHSHKSQKWRIRKVERKLYSNWNRHVFQPESLVKTFIRFLNNYTSIHSCWQGVIQQPIERKHSRFYFCSCQFEDFVNFVFYFKISSTHRFPFGRELSINQLSGSIPDSISALANLKTL